jgi:hypothetical protein
MELSTLFDMLRQFAAGLAPGDAPSELSLRLSSGREIRLPVPPDGAGGFVLTHPDCSAVVHRGVPYTFGPKAAAAVLRMWQARRDGSPDVSQKVLMEAAGSDGSDKRLRDLFRNGEGIHPAWSKLIVPGAQDGTFRLDIS